MADATLREQIAETEKQIADLAAKAQALKDKSRADDLATAKELIKLHSFTASDLAPELKRSRSASTTTKKAAPKSRSKRK